MQHGWYYYSYNAELLTLCVPNYVDIIVYFDNRTEGTPVTTDGT